MIHIAVLVSFLLLALPAFAQVDCNQGLEPIDRDAPSQMNALEFTRAIAAKEATGAKAFPTFGYRVDVNIQTLQGDTVDGDFHQTSDVGFDNIGTRAAKPVAPVVNTLSRLQLPAKDIDAFVMAPPFALTSDVMAEKDVVYSGRQRTADHNPAVFDLLPRNDQAPLRGFIGRVWVRAGVGGVLRTCGRAAAYPIGPMRYEIRRGQVGDDNWFPVLIRADENVRPDDNPVHVRVTVKYSNYKAR